MFPKLLQRTRLPVRVYGFTVTIAQYSTDQLSLEMITNDTLSVNYITRAPFDAIYPSLHLEDEIFDVSAAEHVSAGFLFEKHEVQPFSPTNIRCARPFSSTNFVGAWFQVTVCSSMQSLWKPAVN